MSRDLSFPTILFLDIESSGLYRDNLTTLDPGQPWATSVAAMLCNQASVETNFFSHIIKADGRMIKDGAARVHGISPAAASKIGVPEPRVLGMLADMLKTAPLRGMKVVSYGDLDPRVISSLFARFGASQRPPQNFDRLWATRPLTQFINLMDPWCTQACKIPSGFDNGQWKWPTLDESASILLQRPAREGNHDAFTDMLLLKDLFFHFDRAGYFREAA